MTDWFKTYKLKGAEAALAVLCKAGREQSLMGAKVPAGSYVVMSYEPEMEVSRRSIFTERAKQRSGFITHCGFEDFLPKGEVSIRVMRPGADKRMQTRSELVFADSRVVLQGRLIELVEYPDGDIKALVKLRERVEKSLTKARKARDL